MMIQENATVNVTLMGTNATPVKLDGILSLNVMVMSGQQDLDRLLNNS